MDGQSMKWSCHITNIAAVLGNAPSLLDVTWWDRSSVITGLGETEHPRITVACADATLLKGAEQLEGGIMNGYLGDAAEWGP